MPAATTITENAAERMPSAIPERATVAGPVWAWRATSLTVLKWSLVNHSEICPMRMPTARPITTAMNRPHRLSTPTTSSKRKNVITATAIVVRMAALQVPRWRAAASRSPVGRTRNDPMIDAPMPSAAIASG